MTTLFFPTEVLSLEVVKNLSLLGEATTQSGYRTHSLHTFIYLAPGNQEVHGVLMEADQAKLSTLDRMFADSSPLTQRLPVRLKEHAPSDRIEAYFYGMGSK